MTIIHGLFAVISAVVLFLYGLQGFSRELSEVGGERLKSWLGRVTANRVRGFMIGAFATAVVQSSSAITALAVTLVDATVITYRSSLGLLLGANVGTTATAWLVSFKMTGIGTTFIVVGALVSSLPVRWKTLGKPVFYFGFVFYALDLISASLGPFREMPVLREWLELAGTPWLGILAGLFFTALVQSSSVTAGLAIILVQQGVLPAQAAIPIVIGANVGSTSTALMASIAMSSTARASAMAGFFFNFAGVLIFLPFLGPFSNWVTRAFETPGMAVAGAHLIFNLAIGLFFLATLDWIEPFLTARLRRIDAGNAGRETEKEVN